jgi:hypothetical protein
MIIKNRKKKKIRIKRRIVILRPIEIKDIIIIPKTIKL